MPPTASDRNDERRKRAKSQFLEEIAKISWHFVPDHLSKAPSWMKSDRDIVLAAVKRDGRALGCASGKLKADRDIVMAAVKQNGYSLWHASYKLIANRDIVMAAAKQRGGALEYVRYAPDEMKDAKHVMLQFVKRNWEAIRYISSELQQDPQVLYEATRQNTKALDSIYKNNKVQRDVLLRVLNKANAMNSSLEEKVAEAGEVKKQNKSLKKSVETQAKQIQELEVALASSRPIDSVDLTQEENEEDLKKPSKRARTDDHPKSSLAVISEMSTKMAKIKEEASEKIRTAEKKKVEAEFGLGECPICFEIREEAIALTPCGHVMCAECANENAAKNCPTCQTRVESHLRLHK